MGTDDTGPESSSGRGLGMILRLSLIDERLAARSD